jgi:esterase/lipase
MEVLNVRHYGFQGVFYPSITRKDKVILILTGSEGGIGDARKIAKRYAAQGLPALAVAYFKTAQTRSTLANIPVEYVEAAVYWLKSQGFEKIAVDGFSKGAEYALVASSLLTDISCVIARSPSYFVCEGLNGKKGPTGTSSWSWRGRGLPYTRFPEREFHILKTYIETSEFRVIQNYEAMDVTDESIIPVERIHGPILLLSSSVDTVWPSTESGKKICRRLKKHAFKYPYRHEIYDTVSHFITQDIDPAMKLLLKIERMQPQACRQSRKQAQALILDWLEHTWI